MLSRVRRAFVPGLQVRASSSFCSNSAALRSTENEFSVHSRRLTVCHGAVAPIASSCAAERARQRFDDTLDIRGPILSFILLLVASGLRTQAWTDSLAAFVPQESGLRNSPYGLASQKFFLRANAFRGVLHEDRPQRCAKRYWLSSRARRSLIMIQSADFQPLARSL